MTISIPVKFLNRLVRYIGSNKLGRSYTTQQRIASFLGVSPVTLSRQLNNEKIDLGYLHSYLKQSGLIPDDVPCPQLDSFETYIKLLPKSCQASIIKELIK